MTGEARCSGPCLLYMPKIEDWVVGEGHDGEHNEGDIVKHPEGFGILNAMADGRSETSIDSEDEAVLKVSVPWKLMKQQLQSIPPDNQLMILVGSHFLCWKRFCACVLLYAILIRFIDILPLFLCLTFSCDPKVPYLLLMFPSRQRVSLEVKPSLLKSSTISLLL